MRRGSANTGCIVPGAWVPSFSGVALTICVLVSGCGTPGPQDGEPSMVALLHPGSHPVIEDVVRGFRSRLDELYAPGDVNLVLFNAGFDTLELRRLSDQAVRSDADVLVSISTPASSALLERNRGARPLLFSFVTDPGALGYAGPGSLPNATGLSNRIAYGRTLDLILTVIPDAETVGYFFTEDERNARAIHQGFVEAAPAHGMQIRSAVVAGPEELTEAAEAMAPNVDVFLFGGDNSLGNSIGDVLTTGKRHGVPVFGNEQESVEGGAVGAWSVGYEAMGRRTADLAAAILGGARPDRMPVEVFSSDHLILNREAARYFDLTLPESLLRAAHRIID